MEAGCGDSEKRRKKKKVLLKVTELAGEIHSPLLELWGWLLNESSLFPLFQGQVSRGCKFFIHDFAICVRAEADQ